MRSFDFPPATRPGRHGRQRHGLLGPSPRLPCRAAVLQAGGNAFDAVVATASTLNVVEPYMSGVGGIGVALAHVAREGRVRAIDFSGRAPLAAEPGPIRGGDEGRRHPGRHGAGQPVRLAHHARGVRLAGPRTTLRPGHRLRRERLPRHLLQQRGLRPVGGHDAQVPSADIILGSGDSPPGRATA